MAKVWLSGREFVWYVGGPRSSPQPTPVLPKENRMWQPGREFEGRLRALCVSKTQHTKGLMLF